MKKQNYPLNLQCLKPEMEVDSRLRPTFKWFLCKSICLTQMKYKLYVVLLLISKTTPSNLVSFFCSVLVIYDRIFLLTEDRRRWLPLPPFCGRTPSCGRTLPATWHMPLHTQIVSAYDPGFARKSITVQGVPSEFITIWHWHRRIFFIYCNVFMHR